LGAGAIVNKHLFAGPNCGVGEFGMADYLEHNYEYYASGQYFSHIYNLKGEEVFERAKAGDKQAHQYYAEMGTHLGNAIKLIMYTFDASYIVLGGSVRHAYTYFGKNVNFRCLIL
jgi:glucokinase